MRSEEKNLKEVFSNGLLVVFFSGTIGIALKFFTFFNHWVYFPSFPNALDSGFLILSATYFFTYIILKKRKININNKKGSF
jgi:hypothetical protein